MAHKFWRILVTANDGDTSFIGNIAEMSFLNGGTVVSTGGIPFVSEEFGTGYTVNEAFDNNAGSFWSSQQSTQFPYSIGYEFATATSVDALTIQAASIRQARAPTEFEIQYSDNGTDWTTTLDGLVVSTGWASLEVREFVVTTATVTLAGNATNSAGAAVDKVVIFDWVTAAFVDSVVPTTNGDWSITLPETNYGITYLSTGYAPQTHGPYGPA